VQLARRPLPISAADLKGGSRLPHSTENLHPRAGLHMHRSVVR